MRRIFNKFTAMALVVVMALVFAAPVSLYASSENLPAESDVAAAETLPPAEQAPAPEVASEETNAPPEETAGQPEATPPEPEQPAPEVAEPETVAPTEEVTEPEPPAQEENAPVLFSVSFYDTDGNLLHQEPVAQGVAVAAQPDPAAPQGMRFKGWFEENAIEAFKFEGSVVSGDVKLTATFEALPAAPVNAPEVVTEEAPAIEPEAEDPAAAVTTEEEPALAPEAATTAFAASAAAQGDVDHTVTFKVDGSVYATDTVLDETLVSLPAAPTGQNGKTFVGWYVEGGLPFNPAQLITENLTLVALFDDATVLVTYLNTDGSVLEVLEGTVGEAAPQPTRQPALGMGRELLHWALAGTQDAFTGLLAENITLAPVLEEISLAVFVTQGSEIEPQTDTKGFLAQEPAASTRDGYTFDGWARTQGGSVANFTMATRILESTTVYAVWEAIVVDPVDPDPVIPVDPTPDPDPDPVDPTPVDPPPPAPGPVDPADPTPPTPDPTPVNPEAATPTEPDPTPANPTGPKTTPNPATPETTPAAQPDLTLETTPVVVEQVTAPVTLTGNITANPETDPATPAVPKEVQERLDSQSGNIAKDIMEDNVPLGGPELKGAWSLLSLMMALLGAAISVVVFATLPARKRKESDENGEEAAPRKQRSKLLKALTIVLGLLAGLLFLLLDDMSLPMALVNQWALWVAVPFILSLAVLVAQVFIKRKAGGDGQNDVIEKA